MTNNSQLEFEYVPPKSEDIRAFARLICEELATRTNAPMFAQSHVITGLAGLLEIAARTQAKHLNALKLIDKAKK